MIISRKRYEENIQAATERGMLKEQEAIRRRAATIKDLDDLKRALSKELKDAMTEICEQGRRGEERIKEKIEEDLIERDATGKSEKTVYLQMIHFCGWKEMKDLQNYLNKESPDKIVVLPAWVKMLNPEDTEKVLKEFLNIQSPSEECKKHAEEVVAPQLQEWLDEFAARAQKAIGESNADIT